MTDQLEYHTVNVEVLSGAGAKKRSAEMRRLRVLTLGFVVALTVTAVGLPARAAQETPEAGPNASRFLPEAAVFGDGWERTDQAGIEIPSDIFREGSMAIYAGPSGSRIVVMALLATDSRVAVRQSWEEATKRFDEYRYSVASNADYELAQRLEGLEPTAGCVEAKRAEGSDRYFGFTSGLTMCAVDPDIIVTAVVSGTLGKDVGYAASDAVVTEALQAGGGTD